MLWCLEKIPKIVGPKMSYLIFYEIEQILIPQILFDQT